MSETKELLRRGGEGFAPREGIMDSLIRRRDRKHRNQRIAAGVVGIAVFVAAVWVVTSVGSLDRSETSVVPGVSGTTGPVETGPAKTGPPLACSFVQPRARAHLELTDVGSQIEVRFVLHQMTLPGHRWGIVLRHSAVQGVVNALDTGASPRDFLGWSVFFKGTRLATGDSGDLAVQRRVVDYEPMLDFVVAKAVDQRTGQVCKARAVI